MSWLTAIAERQFAGGIQNFQGFRKRFECRMSLATFQHATDIKSVLLANLAQCVHSHFEIISDMLTPNASANFSSVMREGTALPRSASPTYERLREAFSASISWDQRWASRN